MRTKMENQVMVEKEGYYGYVTQKRVDLVVLLIFPNAITTKTEIILHNIWIILIKL